jgi:hypothetical protein
MEACSPGQLQFSQDGCVTALGHSLLLQLLGQNVQAADSMKVMDGLPPPFKQSWPQLKHLRGDLSTEWLCTRTDASNPKTFCSHEFTLHTRQDIQNQSTTL